MDFDREIFRFFQKASSKSQESFSQFLEKLPKSHFSDLQSLANSFPFPDLHSILLEFLQRNSLPTLPQTISSFLPLSNIKLLLNETRFPNAQEKDLYLDLMQEIFTAKGKIDNHERLMGHFPLYLEKHVKVMKSVFESELSISSVWRYYIAYMAAATHKCEYLMKIEEHLCMLINQSWLGDYEICEKLQILNTANLKLAHRPWEFNESDVKALLRLWNVNELVLALTILCQFHCLSGFVFGLGVGSNEFSTIKPPESNRKSSFSQKKLEAKVNMFEVLKAHYEGEEYEDSFSDSSGDFYETEVEDCFSSITGGTLHYINYPMDSISRSFNPSDFKFADQAYYILEKTVPEISESIWDRIRTTFAMTYECIGDDSGINTGPLRRAFWNYVQRLYGLQYDDYDYNEMNVFLRINTKKYIKKTACFPETITKEDFENIGMNLTKDEMIHLNLIICEARFEAQLVYMLYAVHRAQVT